MGWRNRRVCWSDEDEITFVRWRRGVFILYGGIGLAAAGLLMARLVGE